MMLGIGYDFLRGILHMLTTYKDLGSAFVVDSIEVPTEYSSNSLLNTLARGKTHLHAEPLTQDQLVHLQSICCRRLKKIAHSLTSFLKGTLHSVVAAKASCQPTYHAAARLLHAP
jgi:hypothetical protein